MTAAVAAATKGKQSCTGLTCARPDQQRLLHNRCAVLVLVLVLCWCLLSLVGVRQGSRSVLLSDMRQSQPAWQHAVLGTATH